MALLHYNKIRYHINVHFRPQGDPWRWQPPAVYQSIMTGWSHRAIWGVLEFVWPVSDSHPSTLPFSVQPYTFPKHNDHHWQVYTSCSDPDMTLPLPKRIGSIPHIYCYYYPYCRDSCYHYWRDSHTHMPEHFVATIAQIHGWGIPWQPKWRPMRSIH